MDRAGDFHPGDVRRCGVRGGDEKNRDYGECPLASFHRACSLRGVVGESVRRGQNPSVELYITQSRGLGQKADYAGFRGGSGTRRSTSSINEDAAKTTGWETKRALS